MPFLTPIKRREPLNVWESFFTDLSEELGSYTKAYRAPLDISSNKESVTVRVELPGVDRDSIDIEYEKGILTLKGEKKETKKEKTETLHHTEVTYGSFSRQVQVGEINFDNADAQFENGVLTITLPKTEKELPKKLALN